jgi:transcription elongation GreA/GreB family factor
MHGRRSLNLELTPLHPDLERNIRRACRAHAEMGDNQRNPRMEQHEEHQRNEQEENEEFQDARARKSIDVRMRFHYVTPGIVRTYCGQFPFMHSVTTD